jgi:hypothetical protein
LKVGSSGLRERTESADCVEKIAATQNCGQLEK